MTRENLKRIIEGIVCFILGCLSYAIAWGFTN